MVGITTVMLVVFHRRLGIYMTRHRAICEKCYLQNRNYITYPNAVRLGPSHGYRQHAQKLVKFGRVVFEFCERTDRQTGKQTDILNSPQYFASLPGAK